MKYADMQKQLDNGRFEKRPRNTTPPPRKPVRPREPEPDTPQLFDHLEAESWLGERLKAHGCDLYADGPVFAHFRDRVRKVILDNGMACVIVGRHDNKPESYAQTFQRLYGEPLGKKTPRGTNTTTKGDKTCSA